MIIINSPKLQFEFMKSILALFFVGFFLLGSVAINEAYSLQQAAGTPVIELNPGETKIFKWTLKSDKENEITEVTITVDGPGSEFLTFPETLEIQPKKINSVEFTIFVPSDYSKDVKFFPNLYATEFGKTGGTTIINIQMKKTMTLIIGSPDPDEPIPEQIPSPVESQQIEPEEKPVETANEELEVEKTETAKTEEPTGGGFELVQGPESGGGGCLIATAAYGSELAHQVQFLREVRDNTLFSTTAGATFMTGFNQFYYSFSPTIADLERENPVFREGVKLFITPMISTLSIMTLADEGSEAQVLGLGISVIALNLGMYIAAPVAIAFKIKNTLRKY